MTKNLPFREFNEVGPGRYFVTVDEFRKYMSKFEPALRVYQDPRMNGRWTFDLILTDEKNRSYHYNLAFRNTGFYGYGTLKTYNDWKIGNSGICVVPVTTKSKVKEFTTKAMPFSSDVDCAYLVEDKFVDALKESMLKARKKHQSLLSKLSANSDKADTLNTKIVIEATHHDIKKKPQWTGYVVKSGKPVSIPTVDSIEKAIDFAKEQF